MRVECRDGSAGRRHRRGRGDGSAPAARPVRPRACCWLFAAISVWVLGLDLWQVVVNGRVWTGTDGVYIVDQMQYLAWIRDASHHVLSSNLFVLRPTSADYFQPAIVISGVALRARRRAVAVAAAVEADGRRSRASSPSARTCAAA